MGGINRHKKVSDKEAAAKMLKELIDERLVKIFSGELKGDSIPFKPALEWAIQQKKPHWSHKTYLDFNSVLQHALNTAEKLKLNTVDISHIKKSNIRELIDQMVLDRKLGGHAYDKYKNVLGNLFQYLVDYEKIDINPCFFRTSIKRPKPRAKRLLTDDEWLMVQEHLKKEAPELLVCAMVEYYTFIRPVEITRLKVGDIDLKNNRIWLRAEDAKDKEDREVVIPKRLEPYLKTLKLHLFSANYFAFGYNFIPEERVFPINRDVINRKWNYFIKSKETGLGLPFDFYWLKAMGMQKALELGVPIHAVKKQAGHSMDSQTFVYTTTNLKHLNEALRNIGVEVK